MKNIVLFLFVALLAGACSKAKDDVKPRNPADVVAGTYTLSSFRYKDNSGETRFDKLPDTRNGKTVSGTVKLTPASATDADHVDFLLTLKVTGQKDATISIDGVEVKKTSEAYGLYVDGDLISDADGNSLLFNLSESDAQTKETVEINFVAKK